MQSHQHFIRFVSIKTIYCLEKCYIFPFLYTNNFYVKNVQAVRVLKVLYLKIMILVMTSMLSKREKKSTKKQMFQHCKTQAKHFKPNGLSQLLAETRRISCAKNNTPPHPPPLKTDLLNLNGGSCGYYYMDENVMMTN